MSARYLIGDVFDRLAEIDDDSIDLVITSPPFLALRSYLPADHPDKDKEIGSEATPAAFLDTLLAVTAELRRVLAPHGSIAIELGDTYASGSGGQGAGLSYGADIAGKEMWAGERQPRDQSEGWPLAKSKTLIPEMYRIALAYGFNPLTGQPSPAGQWRVRNTVTWCRPNPPVGALGDKWRPATSDVVIACVSGKRYWDDLATRKPSDYHRESLYVNKETPPGQRPNMSQHTVNTGGAPLLDYWEIPPTGYSGAHYAVYPPALVEPLVKAMGPQKVCKTCGEPQRRIVEKTPEYAAARAAIGDFKGTRTRDGGLNGTDQYHEGKHMDAAGLVEVGSTDCGHDNYRPGIVLDPFAGSGTTLMVATGHGLDAIGIDIDERNAELARERVGPMFFEVVA